MKFRAKMLDIGCINQFTKILSTMGKISKTCALRLSPTQIIMTQSEKALLGGASFWCEICQSDLFDEYRIEGKEESNEIYLEVIIENLVRTMRSSQNAHSIKIKLAKKQSPCLSFEVILPTATDNTRTVTHDVFVGIIPSRFWENFQKPVLPRYDLKAALPNLRTMKAVVERMKNISAYMTISGTKSGIMTLEVNTEDVTATTYFKDLAIEVSQSQEIQTDEKVSARVDIQKLSTFFHVQQFNPEQILCAIVNEMAVHMFLQCVDLKFQYFLPSVSA